MNTFQRPRSLTLRALASTTSKATLLNSMRLMALGAVIGAGLAGPAMAQARDYTIGPGRLSDVLARYAAASGVQLVYDPASLSGLNSSGLSGNYTVEQGFTKLLSGSGYQLQRAGNGSYVLARPGSAASSPVPTDGATVLSTIQVTGKGGNPADAPYEASNSGAYISAEQIERYRGTSPADILKSAPGVYSGQSRASGGIDANIRGLQGQGRVPVTVDGAQNATSMYRGYQGIANSTFIDPDFIGGISIEKGPSNGPGGAGAIGGMVSMRTLNADDLIPEGESFGARIKLEGSGNTTSPWTEQSKRHAANSGERETADYLWKLPDTNVERPNPFNLKSGSASVVLAGRSENVDLVGGFSRRLSGNYHAGKNGSAAPRPADCDDATGRDCALDWYSKGLSIYLPGEEVLNTSQDVYSGLLKGTFRFGDDHTLELGYSLYDSTFGEQYATELASDRDSTYQRKPSHVRVNTYTSRYHWNPDSDLIDLKWNVWGTSLAEETQAVSDTITKSSHMRGTDLSNTSRFNTAVGDLSLQYGLSYLYEDTKPVELNGNVRPREGDRWEASAFTNASWQALDWLRLDGGLRYHRYQSHNKAPGNTDAAQKDDALDYSATVTVMPVEGWQIYGSYKNASRLPSMLESAGGFATIVDPDLRPETSKTWEVGTNVSRNGVFAADDSVRFKLGYFDSTVDDYINRTRISYSQMRIRNIDRAKFSGVDLSARYELGGFSAELGGSYYTNVEYCPVLAACVNSSLSGDYATNYVPPRYSLNLTLTQKLLEDRLMLSGRVTRVGPRAADAEAAGQGGSAIIAQIPWKPYTLVDISAAYKLTDYATLNLAVENLTDVYYIEPLSLTRVPSPGRTVRIGLTADLSAATLNGGNRGDAPPAFDWTGAYAGLHAASGLSGFQMADFSQDGGPEQNYRFEETNLRAAGLQVGYDHQFGNNIVLGVGGEFSWLKADKEMLIVASQRGEARANWLAGVHGRMGYAIGDILIYGTAGYAVADVDGSYATRRRVSGEFVWSGTSDTSRFSGWTAGGGVEYALSKNITVKGEYSFANLSKGSFNPPELNGVSYNWKIKPRIDQLRLGVNYRF